MNKKLAQPLAAIAIALLASGARAGDNPGDPLEGLNRTMFAVNEGLDKAIVKPAAQVYDTVAPLPVKTVVGNFFGNIEDVMIGANNLLQGKPLDALSDWGRVLVNTTIGIGGAFDIASEAGLDKHNEDFGQTLGVWGVPPGAYLFWPVFGPRDVRDSFGKVVDIETDPVGYTPNVAWRNSLYATRYVDQRAALLPTDKIIEEGAIDKYAYIRDAYIQRRATLVRDGRAPKPTDE